jgi:glucose uptake protein
VTFLVLTLAVSCFVTGASVSRLYVDHGHLTLIVGALVLYTIGNILMVRLMRDAGLGPAMSASTVAQLVIANVIAVAAFGERPSPLQVIGIGVGVLAVVLILLPTWSR